MIEAAPPVPRDPVDDGIPEMPATIAVLPFFTAGRFQRADLIGRCQGTTVSTFGGRELVERVRDFGLGLSALGVKHGDRVVLLSESRPEWLVADFAILATGAVTTPIYPTLSVEQVRFILSDSQATMAVVSSRAQLEKIRAASAGTPALQTIVVMDEADALASRDGRVMPFNDVSARGHRRILDGWGVGKEFQDGAKAVRPSDLATIIYTSGTTGEPKGVMLTHANLIGNLSGVLPMLNLSDRDIALSFLPLCHAFERIVAYVYMLSGISMIFAESIDTVARDLQTVRPTVMTGVPRVFEKLYARIVERGHQATGLRRALFDWSLAVARQNGRERAATGRASAATRWKTKLAERLVFGRVRAALGGRLRYAVSGSAPLSPDLAIFYYGIGLPILEGYGLTETSPVLSVMPLGAERFGTVGPPLPNVEIRIAGDGEILARGPNIMAGYYRRPEETAAAIVDGWFHTGDVGELDAEGYLRITGRKKDVLVTSGGKKIAPQPIEDRLRTHALVDEVVVIGDGRHFPAALIVPDFTSLAKTLGVSEMDVIARLEDDDVRMRYQRVVDEANAGLAQFERIKKFVLLTEPFTALGGELTPTLKVKRAVVNEKYAATIEALYIQNT